jgi:hypothetical protein
MKNTEIWQTWTETLEKYIEALADPVQNWKNNHKKMCDLIVDSGKRPSDRSKDSEEKRLGGFISNQKNNYNPRGAEFSKHIMKTNPEIWQIWTDTLVDEKYSEALSDIVQSWKNNHENMCGFINKTGKAPSASAKYPCPEEKLLGGFLSVQRSNYDSRGPEFSKQGMKTPEIWQIWTDTLSDDKYSEALADQVQVWKNNHKKMCEFIDKTRKAPSAAISKDPEEKRLQKYVAYQKDNYDLRGPEFSKQRMKTPEIWQIWTETIQKYPCLKKHEQEQEQEQETSSPSPSPSPPPNKSKPKVSKKSHLIPNPATSLECSVPETNPTSLKRVITDSPYKLTGRAWATQKSCTTHEKLQSNPAEWHAYHAARDISFKGYVDQYQIPRNRVIAHLGNKRKHRLRILDLGCGRNNIARHFADEKDHKFTIQGYDHVAEEGTGALAGNIADLAAQEEDEGADICIYSQSLMGSDWRDYLTEGHRMLRYNGEFIISEHVKMLDDVRAELGRLGCKVESENVDASATSDDLSEDKDMVPKWFVLVARKV